MRRFRLFAGIPLMALALAACGDSSEESADRGSPSSTASAPTSSTVNVADSSLGKVLVDAKGMTLYLFTKDAGGKSACEGSCAALWPPLKTTAAPTAGAGVDGGKLSTITRSDGSMQVAFGGHPLYLYAQDAAPGDVTGQNVGGVWFALRPDGTAVAAGSTSTSGG